MSQYFNSLEKKIKEYLNVLSDEIPTNIVKKVIYYKDIDSLQIQLKEALDG